MLISIIICTYNREDILRVTLPTCLALHLPKGIQTEVIIVDNNSSDQTSNFISSLIEEHHSNTHLKYIFEGQQGVSYARNRGYQESSGEYIAYLDDECILPNNWLETAVGIITKENHPAFLGGPYYGKFLPGTTSTWYKESFGNSYIFKYDLPNGPMTVSYLSEGNMFVRRDIFEKIGVFDESLGMIGGKVAYGEGPDFQRRFIEKYPDEVIWYDSKLHVWHLIRDEKISILYRFKEALIRGASAIELRQQHSTPALVIAPFLFFYYVLKSLASYLFKGIQSLFSKEHFFTLLHHDYENGTWRAIGSAWFRMKLLLQNLMSFRHNQ